MKYSIKIFKMVVIILTTMFYFSQFATAKSTFSQEKLKSACTSYINNMVGQDAEISLPKVIAYQEFKEDNVTANIVTNIDNLQGNTTLKIEFRNSGTLLRIVEIPVRIKLYKNVAVAKETVIAGDIFDEHNLSIEKREITNYKEGQFYSKNSLKGLRAKRNIAKGNIVTPTLVNKGNQIKRGDKVTLIVQSGNVRIKTIGVALQDADEGNNLRVKRDGVQGVFQGKITSDGTILINLN